MSYQVTSTAEITIDVDGTEIIIPDVYGRDPVPLYLTEASDDVIIGPVRADGDRVLTWLVQDEGGWMDSPLDDEAITWDSFRRGDPDRFDGDIDAVNEYLRENEGHAFLVECYSHGLDSYSLVADGKFYPDRQWDVGIAGIITLGDDWTNPREAAASIMESYTSWCNGDVYGIVERVLHSDGTVDDDGDECWGYLGYEYAVDEAKLRAGIKEEEA